MISLQLMSGSKPLQGLRINGGKKQQILRSFKDDDVQNFIIYGKIVSLFPFLLATLTFSQMKGGCCICGAGKCIIVATFDEIKGHSSAGCNDVIQEMAKYLLQISWPSGTQEASGGASGSAGSTWQPYIQTMLLAKGDIKDALICSASDGTIFASTPEFTVILMTPPLLP